MSGDSIGTIVVPVVAIAALPVVATTAAVGAVGYGGYAMAKAISNANQERNNRKLDEMPRSLTSSTSSVYKRLDEVTKKTNDLVSQEEANTSKEIERNSRYLVEEASNVTDEKQRKLREVNTQLLSELNSKVTQIYKEAANEREEILKEYAALKELKLQIIEQKNQSAEEAKKQEELLRKVVDDAKGTIQYLTNQNKTFSSKKLQENIRILESKIEEAENYLHAGYCEVAYATSKDIVKKGMLLAVEEAVVYEEKQKIRTELFAILDGVIAEASSRRYITLSELNDEEKVVEDFDEFCEGRYEEFQVMLQKYREDMDKNQKSINLMELQEELIKVKKLKGRLNDIVDEAVENMQAYYQKMSVLDSISSFMEDQGYMLQWVEAVGGNLSDKLVLNLKNCDTNNSISFSVDLEGDNLSQLVLDMMFFYEQRDIPEREKESLRKAIDQVLEKQGMVSHLQCQDCYGRPSQRRAYKDKQSVVNM